MSCQKAQGFLAANDCQVTGTTVDATKNKHGREQAINLARSVRKVVAARGKKMIVFDMTKDPPDDETLAAHLLGPTGNLKAPTLRIGDTLLVGFGEEAYQQILGKRS